MISIIIKPQLSVRSARARDLAHRLSALERRPIHAIVEDALDEYANRHPLQSAAGFLKKLKMMAVDDIDLEALLADNRVPHADIDAITTIIL